MGSTTLSPSDVMKKLGSITSSVSGLVSGVSDVPTMSDTGGAINQLYFPSNIMDDEFKHRRITLIACEVPAMHNANTSDPEMMTSISKFLRSGFEKGKDAAMNTDVGKKISTMESVTKASITLPLPDDIDDDQSHQWAMEDNGVFDNVKNLASKAGESKFGSYVKDAAASAKNLGNSIGVRMPMVRPHQLQNYKGSNPRSLDLTFTFLPNNQQEAKAIQDIIIAIKAFSSPSLLAGSVSMMPPFFWDLYLSNKSIMNMYRFDSMVCTKVNVKYGEEGMQLFYDGFPKKITLSLAFDEASLTYADNYLNPYDQWIEKRVTHGDKIGSTNNDTK
jgi:hypothetical protein